MIRSSLTRTILLFLALAITSALTQQPSCIGCDHGMECDATPVPIAPDGSYHDPCGDPMLVCQPISASSKNGTCAWITCANTDYIRNWNVTLAPFPQRCNSSSYCPDNGLGCQPLLPPGGACESVRDDECAGQLSMCLNYICTIKSAGLGGVCGIEKIEFRYNYKTSKDSTTQTIERDNCTTGSYCSGSPGSGLTCIPGLALGAPCMQDRECQSTSCSNNGDGSGSGNCIQPTDSFHEVKPYVYGIIGAVVAAFMFAVLFGLWILHRFQSKREREKVALFYKTQEKARINNATEPDDDRFHEMQDNAGGKIVLATPQVQSRGSEAYMRSPANGRSTSTLPESSGSSSKLRPDDDGGSSAANYNTVRSTKSTKSAKSANRGETSRGSVRRKPSDVMPGTGIRYGHSEQLFYATAEEEYEQQQHQQQQTGRIPFLNVPRLSISGMPRQE